MGNNKVISLPREQLGFDKYNGAELMYHTFHISTFASFFSVYLKCKNNKNWFLHFLLLKILLNGINYRIQVREYFCIIQYDEQKILNNQNQQNRYQKLYNYGFATVTLFSTNE